MCVLLRSLRHSLRTNSSFAAQTIVRLARTRVSSAALLTRISPADMDTDKGAEAVKEAATALK